MSTPIRRAGRVHRVLGVDERADAAAPLSFRHDVIDERRLPRGFGAEDLDDAVARQPADTERHVERERPCRDRSDRDLRTVAHAHDGPLAELSLDLSERNVERLLAFHDFILPAHRSMETALWKSSMEKLYGNCPSEHDSSTRTAPPTGADVKGKQRRRTERTARFRGGAGPGVARPKSHDGDVGKPRSALRPVQAMRREPRVETLCEACRLPLGSPRTSMPT